MTHPHTSVFHHEGGGGKVRAFVALDISCEARHALEAAATGLRDAGVSGVRWVRPEAIHLTLKFLGDVDTTRVQTILGALETAGAGTGPIHLELSGLGAFPNVRSPRVIWVGLEGERDRLLELQKRVDRELRSALDIPLEKRDFSPHLTLGRVGDISAEERIRIGEAFSKAIPRPEVHWQVTEVRLIQSTLNPGGAVYHTLGSRSL